VRVIALEAATSRCSVAFVDDRRGHSAARAFEARGNLSRALVPALAALEAETWPVASADLLVVDGGPGSFTGLRVALAAAKGLAFVTSRPLVAVTSLKVIAAAAASTGGVVAFLDARGGLFYYAVYSRRAGDWEETVAPALGPWGDVAALPADVYAGPEPPPGGAEGANWLEAWPDAATLATLGVREFELGGPADVASLRPLYLKRGQV